MNFLDIRGISQIWDKLLLASFNASNYASSMRSMSRGWHLPFCFCQLFVPCHVYDVLLANNEIRNDAFYLTRVQGWSKNQSLGYQDMCALSFLGYKTKCCWIREGGSGGPRRLESRDFLSTMHHRVPTWFDAFDKLGSNDFATSVLLLIHKGQNQPFFRHSSNTTSDMLLSLEWLTGTIKVE